MMPRFAVPLLASLTLAFCSIAAAQNHPSRAIVYGIGSTIDKAADPQNPHNIVDYLHNFDYEFALSHLEGDPATGTVDRAWDVTKDFASAAANLNGVLTQYVRKQLQGLADMGPVDELYVHSWAGAAVMTAINDGVIPAPRRLIVIDPPNLTPMGGWKWQKLVNGHPGMQIDIYINRNELLQGVRENAETMIAHLKQGGIGPSDDNTNTIQDVIEYFVAARVTVRTFRVSGPYDPTGLEGHRLNQFLEFASAHGLYGLTRRQTSLPQPATATESDTFAPVDDYAFAVEAGRQAVPVRAAQLRARAAEQAIRQPAGEPERQEAAAVRQHGWEYFHSLLELACSAPDRFATE